MLLFCVLTFRGIQNSRIIGVVFAVDGKNCNPFFLSIQPLLTLVNIKSGIIELSVFAIVNQIPFLLADL